MYKGKILRIFTVALCFILQWVFITPAIGQNNRWTVQKCIDYALEKNIQIRKTFLTTESNKVNFEAVKASRFPIVDGSARQSFGWADQNSATSNTYTFNGSNNSSF